MITISVPTLLVRVSRFSATVSMMTCLLLAATHPLIADDQLIDFESVEVGKPRTHWEEGGVRVELSHPPQKSKAVGRITFFPHLGTGRKGVVNAIANEAIPIRATFGKSVKKVSVKMWAATNSSAYMEAFDKSGKSLSKQAIEKVPVRKTPEEHVPFFELNVEANHIAYVEIGGSKPGGFVAIDELKWTEATGED